jgi:dTDP-glucose 4,6-dehydratase
MADKKRLLVTGSCGFILGNFLRQVVYEKYPYQLISLDKVNTQSINSMYWNKNHTFYIADIRDSHIIDTIFQLEKPEIVLHGAAETFSDSSIENTNSIISSNVLGTQTIINACVKYKVKKLVYLSTDKVYGPSSLDDSPKLELDNLSPRNAYAATKVAGELLIKAAQESFDLKYNIIRNSNNYGPRQSVQKLIPKIIKCVINNETIPIYGQGSQLRSWTHVQDTCTGIYTVLQFGKDNETYNMSSGQEFSNLEIAMHVCNTLGQGHNLIRHVEDPLKPHDLRYSINSSKLKNIGWKSNLKFKDGIAGAVNWYLNNQWYLR